MYEREYFIFFSWLKKSLCGFCKVFITQLFNLKESTFCKKWNFIKALKKFTDTQQLMQNEVREFLHMSLTNNYETLKEYI